VSVAVAQDVARLERVATLIRENKTIEAERQLAILLRSKPNEPVALNLLGTIRAKQNRLNEAEALFIRSVVNDPRYSGARMNLAYLYLQKRDPAKAVVQLKEVLSTEPTNTEVMVVLGDAYLATNALAEAEQQYLSALDSRLDNAGALLGLAQISRLKGEIKETTIYLTRVGTLTANSTSPELLYKFALLALQAGMSDAAKAALENALKLRPNDPSYMLGYGIAWLRKGDLFEAEKVFRKLVQLQPNNDPAQVHLGYVLLNQKKYDEARLWLEKSARSASPIPEVFYYLGLVAQEQNDDAKAIGLFEKAVQKLPNYAHARIALGANRREVLGTALGRAFRLLAIGSVAGMVLGVLATRVLSYIVYQATPKDPMVLSGVVVTMLAVGLVAAWIPARRALAVNPMILLREE